jgi:hypothetical protein
MSVLVLVLALLVGGASASTPMSPTAPAADVIGPASGS